MTKSEILKERDRLLKYETSDYVQHKYFEKGFDAAIGLMLEEQKVLREALQVLINEMRGTLNAHELAIRYDNGNSNWVCLEMALEKSENALAQIEEWE